MTMTEDVPGVELVAHDTTAMVLAGATPEEILSNATQIADALKGLIETQGLSVSVGRDNKHVEVGGWQAAGAMLGALGGQPLHAETVWSRRMDRDDAVVYEAHVEVKTLAGEIAGAAEAMCSSTERNWRGAEEFAIRSMAETRAESRAYRRAIGWVIKLAGYSPTPAEEMRAAPADVGALGLPAWASPVADVGGVAATLTVLLAELGVTEPDRAAIKLGQTIFDGCSDSIPLCVARVIEHIAAAERADTPAEAVSVDAEATEEAEAPREVKTEHDALNQTDNDTKEKPA